MDIFSTLKPISDLLSSESTKITVKHSLLKAFLIECRTNQKLLAITSWKKVSDGIRNEALKNLSSENAKAYYAFSDKSILGNLLKKVNFKSRKETVDEKASDTDKITSLITRVDALKFLGNIPIDMQGQSKARYTVRIANLNAINLEVIEILDSQLKHL